MDTCGIGPATDAINAERAQKQYYADRENQNQLKASAPFDVEEYKLRREQEIRDRFTYKAPKGDQIARYQALRTGFANLAVLIAQNTQQGQGQEAALANLQIVSMVANKAIADEY